MSLEITQPPLGGPEYTNDGKTEYAQGPPYTFAYMVPYAAFVTTSSGASSVDGYLPNAIFTQRTQQLVGAVVLEEGAGASFSNGLAPAALALMQEDLIKIKPPVSVEEKTRQFEEDSKRVVKVSDVCEIIDKNFEPSLIESLVELFASQSQKADFGLDNSLPERIKKQVRDAALSQNAPRVRVTERYSQRKRLKAKLGL